MGGVRNGEPMRWLVVLAFSCGCALGCGAAQPRSEPSAPRSDQVAMRAPQPANSDPLGTLQPVAVPAQPQSNKEPPAPVAEPAPAPIRVAAQPAPEPYPLHGRDLVLTGRVVIHDVPKSVRVRTVTEAGSEGALLEVIDAHGRRLALIKQTPLSEVALPGGPPLLAQSAASHREAQRDDWDKTPTAVIVDRFRSETHLLTIERRATGSEWLIGGLELGSH
jgi:hypothetical protein